MKRDFFNRQTVSKNEERPLTEQQKAAAQLDGLLDEYLKNLESNTQEIEDIIKSLSDKELSPSQSKQIKTLINQLEGSSRKYLKGIK